MCVVWIACVLLFSLNLNYANAGPYTVHSACALCNASVQIWHGISSSFSANFVRGHILYNVQYILCLYTVQCTLCTEQNLLYSLQNARQIVLIFITRAVTQNYLKFSLFRKSIKNVDENALCLAKERLKMPLPICRLKQNLRCLRSTLKSFQTFLVLYPVLCLTLH